MPPQPHDLLIDAAGDLHRIESAYHAELLVSTLLGSVYALAGTHRAAIVERYTDDLRDHLTSRPEETAPTFGAVIDALTAAPPRESGVEEASDPSLPAWIPLLGRVTCTGTFVYGDSYGDQANYLASFCYDDPDLGGPEHVVSVLVDRNLSLVKDLFLAAPADVVLDRLRSDAEEGDATTFTSIDPELILPAIQPFLSATDALEVLPDSDTLEADRAIALARLRLLAPPRSTEPTVPAMAEIGEDLAPAAIAAFRESPEATRLVGAPGDAASLEFCLDLLPRYAASGVGGDVLRWSPTVVRLFLLDWVPSNAVLDDTDLALLPRVLDAWVRWAGRIQGLTPRLVAATIVTISTIRSSFVARTKGGALRSPQAQAVARLLADGVDITDPSAVERWLEAYNAENPSAE